MYKSRLYPVNFFQWLYLFPIFLICYWLMDWLPFIACSAPLVWQLCNYLHKATPIKTFNGILMVFQGSCPMYYWENRFNHEGVGNLIKFLLGRLCVLQPLPFSCDNPVQWFQPRLIPTLLLPPPHRCQGIFSNVWSISGCHNRRLVFAITSIWWVKATSRMLLNTLLCTK